MKTYVNYMDATIIEVGKVKERGAHKILEFSIKEAGVTHECIIWNDELTRYLPFLKVKFHGHFTGWIREDTVLNINRIREHNKKSQIKVSPEQLRENQESFKAWLVQNGFVKAKRGDDLVTMKLEDTVTINGVTYDMVHFIQDKLGADKVLQRTKCLGIDPLKPSKLGASKWKALKQQMLIEAMDMVNGKPGISPDEEDWF
jgi:cytochrome b involved in lipid metabolism